MQLIFFSLQSEPVTLTHHPFEHQLSKVYSRNVFNKFKETQKASTRFTMRPDPGKNEYYLVKLRPVKRDFPWMQHEFCVKAMVDVDDPENSVFSCECMTWEHIGMLHHKQKLDLMKTHAIQNNY